MAPEGVMPDEKDPDEKPCPPPAGTSIPAAATRITNFAERARKSGPPKPGAKKLPPRPGRLPDEPEVDPGRILNREDETDE